MGIAPLFRLSVKYVYRYRRRYLFLFLALAFGFCIITVISSEKDGMYQAAYMSAQGHYAGDLVVLGSDHTTVLHKHLDAASAEQVIQASKEAELNPVLMVSRTIVTFENASSTLLYYNGAYTGLQHVYGIDWDAEKTYFDSLNYTAVSADGVNHDDTMIISRPVAEDIGAGVGDLVLLEIRNRYNQSNTASFVVSAIVDDLSVFGYLKVYVSKKTLNSLIAFGENDCSVIGFYFSDTSQAEAKRQALYTALSGKNLNLAPLAYNRNLLELHGGSGIRINLITIPVYLTELASLLDAIDILSYFMYAIMLLIILASAAMTYNLILHDRSGDIGTMRAIGFYESDVRHILCIEVLILGLLALIAGFVLARFATFIASHLSFSWIAGFELFMKNGSLQALYNPDRVVFNALLVYVILFIAVLVPVFAVSRRELPGMLSGSLKE
jgi:putative ABC transport system permease protein